MGASFDFSGWATKNDLKCSDGRTIRRNAFKANDGQTVPLVWNHQHNEPFNVLGHAMLENRDEGVYAYCTFNDTEAGQTAKSLVKSGDVKALSIYANQLRQKGADVIHGAIREVSLVLAGANPGAYIDTILAHSDDEEEEAVIYTGEELFLSHACGGSSKDDSEEEPKEESKQDLEELKPAPKKEKELEHSKEEKEMANNEKTVQDVFDELTDEQKNVVYAIIGQAIEDAKNESKGEADMKHNVFDYDENNDENVLSHSEMETIFGDAKRYGSLKDSVLAHGITNISYLFPDAKTMGSTPDLISRDMDWVQVVMNGVHHTPFSRVKSMHANITADEARAKGYVKGNQKTDETIVALKRTTEPTTIYKKQSLDRDDVIDITDFDVVSWIKSEMRMMLDEEIARAILIGDGRSAVSNDKINETHIRPIWTDSSVYTINSVVNVAANATSAQIAKATIQGIVRSYKDYKGSGKPVFFTSEEVLTEMLLLEDKNERVIYDTVEKLATALRVSKIVTVPAFSNLTRTVDSATRKMAGIIVNLNDYNVGADKGGAVNMFDDFDIDYNKQKYLIETRCSGAMTKPYAAIAVEVVQASAEG